MKTKLPLFLSLWYVTHFFVLLGVAVFVFPRFEGGSVAYPSVFEIFSMLQARFQVSIPGNLIVFSLGAVLLLAVIFWGVSKAFAKTLRSLAMREVFNLTRDALAWGTRNFFMSGFVLLSAALFAGISLAIYFDNQPYFAAPVTLICLTVFLMTPLFTLNKRVLESNQVENWFKFDWPGWQPLIICFSLFAMLATLDVIVDALPKKLLLVEIAFQMISYTLDVYVYGVLLSVLVYRIEWREIVSEVCRRANFRFFVAWILLDVRFFLIALWFVPPILLVAFTNIYVAPQLKATFDVSGERAGMLFTTFLHIAQSIASYWFVLALPLGVLVLMIYGRFLLLYDNLMLPASCNSAALRRADEF